MRRRVHRAAIHDGEAGLRSCIPIDTCGACPGVYQREAGNRGGDRPSALRENPYVFFER